MANVLRMADQAAIVALWKQGWSRRRISRGTGAAGKSYRLQNKQAVKDWETRKAEACKEPEN